MKTNLLLASLLITLLNSCVPLEMGPRPQTRSYAPSYTPASPPSATAPYSQNSTRTTTQRPQLQRLPNGHYRVLADWPVTVSGRNFIIQKGYTSNGITAPSTIKRMLGDHINAPETWTAVFHDWCFTQKNLTRLQADNYFIQLMKDFGISPRKVQIMGATVKGYSLYKGN